MHGATTPRARTAAAKRLAVAEGERTLCALFRVYESDVDEENLHPHAMALWLLRMRCARIRGLKQLPVILAIRRDGQRRPFPPIISG